MDFDPRAATAAYLDALGPEALARSRAYTEGGHWLMLWTFVVGVAVAWLIVRSGALDRIAARLSRRGPGLRAFVVAVAYFVLAALLSLPWRIYQGWWRERDYGRTSQPFADAFGQGLLAIAISSLLAGLFFTGVYALLRRAGPRWWLWAGGLAALGGSVVLLLAPITIEPLFNRYEPLQAGPVRDALAAMARGSGIPEDRIFVYDGSRQSNNFTANVAGLGPYARIAISDVALKGASLDEVRAVTAHEMGHYALHHVWRAVVFLSLLAMAAFWVADRLYAPVARGLGSRAAIADPTGLPVVMVIVSLLFLLATPVVNAFVRWGEREADAFSLRTVNLPDALASALVKTADYRYPRPGPVEEFVFYSHPSAEQRVLAAMVWKAAHPQVGK